jgi:hypothetical protein
MKLCKDCRWAELRPLAASDDPWSWRCQHPSGTETLPDAVTGGTVTGQISCILARSGVAPRWCGPEGCFWKAKDAGDSPPVLLQPEKGAKHGDDQGGQHPDRPGEDV